jgi:hypothetical protein
MALSSNSIIHFTRSKSALRGILEDNFTLKYCTESINLVGDGEVKLAVPMVSFCDIPLSQVKEHIGKYGNYGIGLTKEWAIKRKLNPVLYLQVGSSLARSFGKVIINYKKTVKGRTPDDEHVLNIIRYSKNYQGDLCRAGNKTTHNYRFSDEREWRYVPTGAEVPRMFLSSAELSQNHKDAANADMASVRLVFEPDDIRYIIIKDENEIGYFLRVLREAKGKNYPAHAIERLSTRILTTAKIMTDF